MEGQKVLSAKKVRCSGNKNIFDFAKEVFHKLHGQSPGICSLKIQVKKYLGFRLKSKQMKLKAKFTVFF